MEMVQLVKVEQVVKDKVVKVAKMLEKWLVDHQWWWCRGWRGFPI